MTDTRYYILIIIALAILTVAFFYYRRVTFTPAGNKEMSRVQKAISDLEKRINPSTKKDVETRHNFVKKAIGWPFIGLSERTRLELTRALDAIEWSQGSNITVEDIYFMMLTNLVATAVVALIAGIIWRPLFLLLLACPIMFNLPVTRIRSIVTADEKQMRFEFPDFYDIVYVQYREHTSNVLMSDIVEQYIPIAGPAFRNMLRRFALDLPSGEDYALEQLDKRYLNNQTIHRFTSVMRQRLKGEEASYVAMDHFRETLQADVHDWMAADLERRKATAARLTGILVMVLLSVVMIVYFAMFFKTAISGA